MCLLHSQPAVTINSKLHFGTYLGQSSIPKEDLTTTSGVIVPVALWAPCWGANDVHKSPALRHVRQQQNVDQYYYLHCKLDTITDFLGFM